MNHYKVVGEAGGVTIHSHLELLQALPLSNWDKIKSVTRIELPDLPKEASLGERVSDLEHHGSKLCERTRRLEALMHDNPEIRELERRVAYLENPPC